MASYQSLQAFLDGEGQVYLIPQRMNLLFRSKVSTTVPFATSASLIHTAILALGRAEVLHEPVHFSSWEKQKDPPAQPTAIALMWL